MTSSELLEGFLTGHNENHLHLVELAGKVGEIAAKEENSEELLQILVNRLDELKQEELNQPDNSFSFNFFVGCWKTVLGLGVLVASQEKAKTQKELLDKSLLGAAKSEIGRG